MVVRGEQVTLENLINFLSGSIQRPIQGETGLDSVYEIALHFTPADENGNVATREQVTDPSGPSLFIALQDQLGLRPEPRKLPVDVFVIDHVERPSEN